MPMGFTVCVNFNFNKKYNIFSRMASQLGLREFLSRRNVEEMKQAPIAMNILLPKKSYGFEACLDGH